MRDRTLWRLTALYVVLAGGTALWLWWERGDVGFLVCGGLMVTTGVVSGWREWRRKG